MVNWFNCKNEQEWTTHYYFILSFLCAQVHGERHWRNKRPKKSNAEIHEMNVGWVRHMCNNSTQSTHTHRHTHIYIIFVSLPKLTCGRCIVHLQLAIKHDFVAETLQNLITFYEHVFHSLFHCMQPYFVWTSKTRGANDQWNDVRIEDSVGKNVWWVKNKKLNLNTIIKAIKRQWESLAATGNF